MRRLARRGPRRLAGALLLLLTGAGLCALYFLQSRAAPFNSDGAANVLQGQAIVTGNPLLRGWWTSDVSFYTTELPLYALVTAIRGLSPDVVHLCGAITYTLTVLLAALVARGGGAQPGASVNLGTGFSAGCRAGWYRAGIAAGIMLAPSILGGTEVFLQNPDHAGTAVLVLLLLLLLGRPASRRGRWLRPAGACALLTLAQAGDGLTLVAATAPLAVVSALRLAAARWPRAGRGRAAGPAAGGTRTAEPGAAGPHAARSRRSAPVGVAPLDGPLLDGALLAAAVASAGLARLLDLALRALGGFDVRPLGGVALASPRLVPANAGLLWRSLILLFGANNPGPPRQAQTISAHGLLVGMADLHVIGLLLAAAGLAAGIAALATRRADRVTQMLLAAVVAVLAAGAGTTVLRSLSNAHEVAVLLPLGAVLAGRTLPEAFRLTAARLRLAPGAARLRRAPRGTTSPPLRARRRAGIAILVLGAWLALNAAELGYAAAWPAVPPPQQAVAAWLVAHHERTGLAGYWQAASTTVTSGGRVLVAAITLGPAPATAPSGAPPGTSHSATVHPAAGRPATSHPVTAQAAAERWETSADWYQPARHEATFVIAAARPGRSRGRPPGGRGARPLRPSRRPVPGWPGSDHDLPLQPAHPGGRCRVPRPWLSSRRGSADDGRPG